MLCLKVKLLVSCHWIATLLIFDFSDIWIFSCGTLLTMTSSPTKHTRRSRPLLLVCPTPTGCGIMALPRFAIRLTLLRARLRSVMSLSRKYSVRRTSSANRVLYLTGNKAVAYKMSTAWLSLLLVGPWSFVYIGGYSTKNEGIPLFGSSYWRMQF